jgi:hypothetical protein
MRPTASRWSRASIASATTTAANAAQALSLYERHRFRVHFASPEWHKPLEIT